MRKAMLILASATLIAVTACGAGTLRSDDVDVPPSPASAGSDSGGGIATGGEHYTIVHSIGSSLPKAYQTSTNERYSSKQAK